MTQLDSTIVLTALPQMARSFHTRSVDLSLGVTVYLLAQAVLLPCSGWFADRFGAKPLFALSIGLFAVSSIACGLCTTLPAFALARVFQGASAAAMTPVARVLLLRFTPKQHLVSAIAMSSAAMLIAPTLGPPLGGLITTYASWRWVFGLNAPVAMLGIFLVLRYVPAAPAAGRRPFDTVGFILSGSAISLLLYGLDRAAGWTTYRWVAIAMAVSGVVIGAVAVIHARRAAHPLVSLAPFKSKSFRILSLGGGALCRLPVRAAPFLLSLMFQTSLGMSAFKSGLFLLGFSAGDLLLKAATIPTMRRFGFRSVIICSTFGTTAAIMAAAFFGAMTPWWVVLGVLVLAGMFRSFLFSGMSTLIYADVQPNHVAAATVLWNVMQQITNALGISLAAIMLNGAVLTHAMAGAKPTLIDFRLALLGMCAFGLAALPSFAKFPRDAGAELTAA